MKKSILCFALLLSTSVFAHKQPPLVGLYECHGYEVDSGSPFTCEIRIAKTGDTYSNNATCDDGTSYEGTAIYDKKARILSIGFVNPNRPDETGIVMAHVHADGSTTSDWTYLHKTTIAHGTCTPPKQD